MQDDIAPNTYILGHTDTEKVRLIEQDRHFNRAMGGLLAEQPESVLASVRRVLDVASGPGGWALDLAQQYPDIQVVGVDIDEGMIQYANTMARASGLDNALFQVMDATKPLDFPDESFDLVNARFLVGFLTREQWPTVTKDLLRICRSGGVLRMTESEWGGTSSASYEQSLNFTILAQQRVGQGFSVDGRHVGITPYLRHFLQQAGGLNVQEVAYALDFSTGTPMQALVCDDLWVAQKLLQPFHVGMGVATQEEVDHLYERIPTEMLSNDFYGTLYMLTTWGNKS
jgi:ubiquinone/menaquinone biosynthesis C-methylase UbiE